MFTRVGKFRRAAWLSPHVPRVSLAVVLGLASMAMLPICTARAEPIPVSSAFFDWRQGYCSARTWQPWGILQSPSVRGHHAVVGEQEPRLSAPVCSPTISAFLAPIGGQIDRED